MCPEVIYSIQSNYYFISSYVCIIDCIFNLPTEYRIVIICSSEDEDRAHVVSKFHQYRREYPPLPPTDEIASYLKMHFINQDYGCAAVVDPEM